MRVNSKESPYEREREKEKEREGERENKLTNKSRKNVPLRGIIIYFPLLGGGLRGSGPEVKLIIQDSSL